MVEITIPEKNTEKIMKKMKTAWHLWDNIKCTNIHIIRVPEEEEFKEIIAENFPNSGRGIMSRKWREAQAG